MKDLMNRFCILNGEKHFLATKHITYFSGTNWIDSWKSNVMSEENIENIAESESNSAPTFLYHHLLPDMNFNGHCLIKYIIFLPLKK